VKYWQGKAKQTFSASRMAIRRMGNLLAMGKLLFCTTGRREKHFDTDQHQI